jgi:hypothetical protein
MHTGPSTSIKRPAETEGQNPRPWKTRGVKLDYKQLDNSFSDSEDEEDSIIVIQLMINDESYNATTSDGPINLTEVKKSPDWPEWEKAIQAKLDQLQNMGT